MRRPLYLKAVQQKLNAPRTRRSLDGPVLPGRQRGVMSMMMPFALLATLMVGALAVDIGHLYLAQAELQTAADAAALAGAGSLLPQGSTAPNWSAASAAGASAVALNTSEGVTLRDSNPTSVKTGYWNVTGNPAGLQATTITPGNNDTTAVQVTVSRAAGLNGGPVSYFLAPVFGMNNGPVSATAVAMVSGPGSIAPGGLFPMAVSQCTAQNYSSNPPVVVQIGDGGTPPAGCPASSTTGQWTNLGAGGNGASTVSGLMNVNAVTIGELIALGIDSGVKASLYKDVYQGPKMGTTVLVPVVSAATASTSQAVMGFAAFHITDSTWQGQSKYITGYFVPGYKITATGDGQVGPYFGAYLPPRLVQ